MGTKINLVGGQRFGRLTVVGDSGNRIKIGGVIWRCICSCGNLTEVAASSLKSGNTKSCGCLPRERIAEMGKNSRINLTGQRFGRLKVIQDSGKRTGSKHGDGHVIWGCRCDCGKWVNAISGNLRYGHTKSCGCLQKETVKIHGKVNISHGEDQHSRLYTAWVNIKRGSRRIKVCKKWLDRKVGYISFRHWALNHGYSAGPCNFIVDRIDRRKNFSPSNCRLITRSEMQRNIWKDGRRNH